jgi:hypothetical protein
MGITFKMIDEYSTASTLRSFFLSTYIKNFKVKAQLVMQTALVTHFAFTTDACIL